MKKFFCFVMIFSIILCALPFSAGAVKAAKTEVRVKSGDTVKYELFVDRINENVVGCDFSVYYDPDVLEIDSVADFTGSTDKWQAVVNYKRVEGTVIENWSILDGIKITSDNPITTVEFKAKSSAKTHISYYIRYMYPETLVEFTEYTFTCNVYVNGKKIIEDEQPELNTDPDTEHTTGEFINSVTGKSEDANINAYNTSKSNSKLDSNSNSDPDLNPDNSYNSNNSSNSNSKNGGATNGKDASVSSQSKNKKNSTDETVLSLDGSEASKNEVATKSEASSNKDSKGNFPYALWIVIGLIILLVAGAGGYYFIKVKKNKNK